MSSSMKSADFRHRIQHLPANIFIIMADIYAVVIVLLLIAALVAGESFLPANLFISLLPGMLYPLVIFLPGVLLLRKWRSVAFQLPGILTFLILYGSMFIPGNAAMDSVDLTVMTFNVMYNAPGYAETAAVIRDADADIVALQEVSLVAKVQFEATLADRYPYQVYEMDGTVENRATLSRYPIVEATSVEGQIRRVLYQRVVVDVNDRQVIIYNIHAPTPSMSRGNFRSDYRRLDIELLMRDAASEVLPVILMGDFNMSDASDDYRYMQQTYTDTFAFAGQGLGVTFPNFGRVSSDSVIASPVFQWLPPLIRLDYIFIDDAFESLHSEVIYQPVSDHFPVKTLLRWTED